ncbi:bifunctional transcriptional activator/DNA repair enzyme AdaA [Aeromonas hydrophila]|uniref:bifunctional transcriptional activator/DNA repair enzyme AdaA n=1 Tax=Aeromonas hydrophila TaxID=644 RepID=UPI00188F5311|nr:methylated-DNA--[protein]-cysteine S-methyltransferase [Aeromonas hydrophila]MBF4800371.1 methylated-DNA--[protein]-cysteine S-methyltransferase [Aeromonas hydrophila]
MSDYARIADAIRFIASQVARQPTLDEIAAHVHLSPFHFQRLFSRWAGVTPKRYLQVLTLERAKALLQESRPLLEVADTLGLSSGSRLYDHFVQLEAVTPGEYKQRGAGLVIDHGVHDTPFGQAFVALTPRGVCNFSFLDDQAPQAPLTTLAQSWPEAELREAPSRTRGVIHTMFDSSKKADRPISLHVSGTNFQISVWRALLQIPPAKVVSYAQVASAVGNPKAARAVGLAVGANPVAFMIPCHRVIQQNGKLGGYHWGETRKQAIHAWEAARYE